MSRLLLQLSTELRSGARRLGVLRLLKRPAGWLRRMRGHETWESGFGQAMLDALQPGDAVWDIGANVGFYSEQFAAAVGPAGAVLAFEPTPVCHARLAERMSQWANTRTFQMALGESEGVLPIALASNELAGTHSLVGPPVDAERVVDVSVVPGDLLVVRDGLPAPTFVKIDVEGFEEEVIRGLQKGLSGSRCRAVFCEIHFSILDARGERQAPARIEALLREWGFETRWVDASHLAAERR